MPVQNEEIADAFTRVAEILSIQGENPFRVRAYEKAAATVGRLPRPVAEMIGAGEDLCELPGIGADLAGKIIELVRTHHLALLDELIHKTEPAVLDLLRLRGIGPRHAQILYEQLGIKSLPELEKAIGEGRLEGVKGFGDKTIQAILTELGRVSVDEKRFLLSTAEHIIVPLVAYLTAGPGVDSVTVAGSFRRRKETVGDVDILVIGRRGEAVAEYFASFEDVESIIAKGKSRAAVVLRQGLQVDLRVVPKVSYGAALVYFTGSKAHNIALRRRAQDRKLKINEYGVFRGKKRISGRTEADVYRSLRLPYIEPELREDLGEIDAAEAQQLPRLITLADLKGNLHTHTTDSDGSATVEEMALAAEVRGFEYLGITDHSPALAMAKGLNAKRLGRQIERIEALNAGMKHLRLLAGIEVDIHDDGSLDLPNSILKRLDVVFAAIHSGLKLSRDAQTKRILKAMDNPYVNIIAHPTGRLLGKRRAYDLDVEKILAGAAERNCFLEINAQPDRLDLNDIYIKMAKERGVKLVISADAHATGHLDNLRYGVDQARRGWLEKNDVLNTRSWSQIEKLIKRP